jgi:predicted nucleic acid-binding Zn ribbon protein
MKKVEAQSVGDIIHEVFHRAGLEANEAQQRACLMWADVVGPSVNRLTTRRYVAPGGVMHVFIASAALKNDLQFMRSSLLEQLNATVGVPDAIKDLIIH